MDIRQFSFDKNQIGNLVSKAYAEGQDFVSAILARFLSTKLAPDDFATRPQIPSWEEYEAASNAQILDRLHKNPAGLLNEQPFIDTLMNVRNAENYRKQTRHVVLGFYILALAVMYLAYKAPQSSEQIPQQQIIEQTRTAEKAIENTASLLKEDFNLKLQTRDLEIRDLKRQIAQLTQAQNELTRQIKAMTKNVVKPAPVNPPPVSKPVKPPVH